MDFLPQKFGAEISKLHPYTMGISYGGVVTLSSDYCSRNNIAKMLQGL
jgi:hypothetical protein